VPHRLELLTTLAFLVMPLCLAGCSSGPQPGWEAVLEDAIEDRSGDFAHGGQILAGFDAIGAADDLAVGDTLLFGIRLDVGDRCRIWYLRIRVDGIETAERASWRRLQPFEKRVTTARRKREAEAALQRGQEGPAAVSFDDLLVRTPGAWICVEAFDEMGTSLGVAVSEESVRRLRTGLWSACVAGHAQHDLMKGLASPEWQGEVREVDEAAYADIETVAEGVASCDSFFAILRTNPVMKQILYEVIALPSLWSIVTNLGVRAGFGIDFFAATRVAPECTANANGLVWSVPMTIDLNDQPALLVRILAAPSDGPAAAAAGVYGLVGRHPTDPGRRVHVQLLSSRRGV
jgi:hypothetical protein